MRRTGMMMVAACLVLAACSSGQPAENGSGNEVAVATPTSPLSTTPTPALPTDEWIGRWVGVEGLVLDVAAGGQPGTYKLHIALMDGANDYAGTADGETIHFTRDGAIETIRHTDGEATGLKWLAEKTDCLTIKAGEGFCRG